MPIELDKQKALWHLRRAQIYQKRSGYHEKVADEVEADKIIRAFVDIRATYATIELRIAWALALREIIEQNFDSKVHKFSELFTQVVDSLRLNQNYNNSNRIKQMKAQLQKENVFTDQDPNQERLIDVFLGHYAEGLAYVDPRFAWLVALETVFGEYDPQELIYYDQTLFHKVLQTLSRPR